MYKESMPPLGFTPVRIKVFSSLGGLCCYEPGLPTGQEITVDSSGAATLSEFHLDEKLESVCFRKRQADMGADAKRLMECIAEYFRFGFRPMSGCDTGSWRMMAEGAEGQKAELRGDVHCTTHALSEMTRIFREATSFSDAIFFGTDRLAEDAPPGPAVVQVSVAAAFGLASIPYDAETTISDAVAREYAPEGYRWERTPLEVGGAFGLSRDHGLSFLIRDEDLFDAIELIEEYLNNWYLHLEFTYFDGAAVGLPYNIPFTVKRGKLA